MRISHSKKGESAIITLMFLSVFIWTLALVSIFIVERTAALKNMGAVQRRVDNIHRTDSAHKELFTIPFGRLPNKQTKNYPVYMDFGN